MLFFINLLYSSLPSFFLSTSFWFIGALLIFFKTLFIPVSFYLIIMHHIEDRLSIIYARYRSIKDGFPDNFKKFIRDVFFNTPDPV